ncbi:MAG: type II/IV secretion system protein [Fibrobacteria bacterium]|nr:type II/IV secretion system protein [Fibrobacteria bacterium]
MMHNPDFWKTLVSAKIVDRSEFELFFRQAEGDPFRGLEMLVRSRPQDKNRLCRIWADSLAVATVDLDTTIFAPDLIERIPKALAEKVVAIPLYELGGTVTIACADPMDRAGLQEISSALRMPVSPVFSWPDDIRASIGVHYQSEAEMHERVRELLSKPFFQGDETVSIEQLHASAGDQAIVEFSQALLLLAAKERASDIHIEPGEFKVRIRFRIDGVLHEKVSITHQVLLAMVIRLKVISNLDIVEKRKPQDGRLSIQLPGRSLDFRFSSIPSIYGEKVVLRLLSQMRKASTPSLDNLSFSARTHRAVHKAIRKPNGVFLLTGPTGSGKTTTLYAILRELNREGVNIMTIEDPVEIRLEGITQVQVNHAVDLNFANALRSFLRQDPDVILVGEIRDEETARIALQAALTGHFVLSTLHANSAVHAVTRLLDFGIEPYLVSPALVGVMGQRLVRRVCEACREPYEPPEDIVEELFDRESPSTKVVFHKGRGCAACGGTGYYGRLGIHETLLVDDALRTRIALRDSAQDLALVAKEHGYAPLRWDGMKKVLRGLTTLEELDRISLDS